MGFDYTKIDPAGLVELLSATRAIRNYYLTPSLIFGAFVGTLLYHLIGRVPLV